MGLVARWKERSQQRRRDDGFGWAMTARYLHQMSIDCIEAQMEVDDHFDKTEFNRGAHLALAVIRRIDLVPDQVVEEFLPKTLDNLQRALEAKTMEGTEVVPMSLEFVRLVLSSIRYLRAEVAAIFDLKQWRREMDELQADYARLENVRLLAEGRVRMLVEREGELRAQIDATLETPATVRQERGNFGLIGAVETICAQFQAQKPVIKAVLRLDEAVNSDPGLGGSQKRFQEAMRGLRDATRDYRLEKDCLNSISE